MSEEPTPADIAAAEEIVFDLWRMRPPARIASVAAIIARHMAHERESHAANRDLVTAQQVTINRLMKELDILKSSADFLEGWDSPSE